MPRIVPGNQGTDFDAGAIMRGFDRGSKYRAQKNQEEQQRARMMMSIQQAMGEHKAQQAKALADVNARAQMGDVQALQQQMMEAQAANMPPEAKMLQEVTGLRQRMMDQGADPKALQTLDETYGGLVKQLEAAKQDQAFEGMLADAEKDVASGVFTPEQIQDWRTRKDTGEPSQNLSQEVMKARYLQAQAQQATAKNQKALEQAQQLVQAAPEGYERDRAEIVLNMALASQAAMEKPDAGPRILADVQRALLGNQKSADAENALKIHPYDDPKQRDPVISDLEYQNAGERPTEPQIRERIGFVNPQAKNPFAAVPERKGRKPDDASTKMNEEAQIPTLRGQAQQAQQEPPDNIETLASMVVEETKTPQEFKEALRAKGIDLNDPKQLAKIKKALAARRTNAQAQAGVER